MLCSFPPIRSEDTDSISDLGVMGPARVLVKGEADRFSESQNSLAVQHISLFVSSAFISSVRKIL